jgi:hypothetical protein
LRFYISQALDCQSQIPGVIYRGHSHDFFPGAAQRPSILVLSQPNCYNLLNFASGYAHLQRRAHVPEIISQQYFHKFQYQLQSTIHCTQKDSYIQATMGNGRSVERSCETVMCQQDKESTSSQKDHVFELTHQLQELFLNFPHAKITRTPD